MGRLTKKADKEIMSIEEYLNILKSLDEDRKQEILDSVEKKLTKYIDGLEEELVELEPEDIFDNFKSSMNENDVFSITDDIINEATNNAYDELPDGVELANEVMDYICDLAFDKSCELITEKANEYTDDDFLDEDDNAPYGPGMSQKDFL